MHDGEFIHSFLNESTKKILVIVGPSYSGKTTLVKTELEKVRNVFNIIEYTGDSIENALCMTTISDDLKIVKAKQTVFFIDDLEYFIVQNKNFKAQLTSPEAIKFILTCSPSEEKKLSDIKSQYIVFHRFENSTDKDYVDKSNYEIVSKLFENYEKDLFNDIEEGISQNKLVTTFMMYDNAHFFLTKESMSKVFYLFALFSSFEDISYKTCDWNLIKIFSLILCAHIRHLQKQDLNAKINIKNINFTQIFHRTSQNINIKKQQHLYLFKTGYTYNNLLYMANKGIYPTKEKCNLKTLEGISIHAIKSNLYKKY